MDNQIQKLGEELLGGIIWSKLLSERRKQWKGEGKNIHF